MTRNAGRGARLAKASGRAWQFTPSALAILRIGTGLLFMQHGLQLTRELKRPEASWDRGIEGARKSKRALETSPL